MPDHLKKPALSLDHWYRENKRDLPWRHTKDPYKILVSEIMLQQTIVKVVIPYYERFLKTFPTAKALADAPEEKVLSLWSGLGYYSRARSLHKAAKVLSELPEVPRTFEKWLELPGVGPYTAAAVSSISFSQKVAAVDGNVIRVLSRFLDISEIVTTASTRKLLAQSAQDLISQSVSPAVHNQAMMELGATICTPKNPACLICPLAPTCKSLKNGTQLLRPVKDPLRKSEAWLWELDYCAKKDAVALVKGENGSPWLSKTYVFPGRARKVFVKPAKGSYDFTHAITHHKIYVKVKSVRSVPKIKGAEVAWVKKAEIHGKGHSSVVKKVLSLAERSSRFDS